MGDPGIKNGDPSQTHDRYVKAREAIKVRRSGAGWDEVADTVGYASRGRACTEVKWAMNLARAELFDEVELYRMESYDRLLELFHAQHPAAINGDVKASAECRHLISAMDDLTGAKAPVKYEIGEADVDRLLRDAEAEIGRRAVAADVEAARLEREAAAGSDADAG